MAPMTAIPRRGARNGSTRVWRRQRDVVFALKGRRCRVCGAYADQIDHYPVTYADGGPDELWNLWPICARHNREAGMAWVRANRGRTPRRARAGAAPTVRRERPGAIRIG
jgi:5-methylcytosine-specific restriction endonuclease McrA